MNIPVQTITTCIVMSVTQIQKMDVNALEDRRRQKMVNEDNEKSSPDAHVTMIDTTGPIMAQMLKEIQMLRQELREFKSTLRRLTN
jgi:K+/H+ antiporter YhaU regulatory subunit KhtT